MVWPRKATALGTGAVESGQKARASSYCLILSRRTSSNCLLRRLSEHRLTCMEWLGEAAKIQGFSSKDSGNRRYPIPADRLRVRGRPDRVAAEKAPLRRAWRAFWL